MKKRLKIPDFLPLFTSNYNVIQNSYIILLILVYMARQNNYSVFSVTDPGKMKK